MSVRLPPHAYSSGLRKIDNSDGIISWEFYFTIESPMGCCVLQNKMDSLACSSFNLTHWFCNKNKLPFANRGRQGSKLITLCFHPRAVYQSRSRRCRRKRVSSLTYCEHTCWSPPCYANLSSHFLILQYWWWQPTLNPRQGFPFYFIVKTWSVCFLSWMRATQKV